MLGNDNMPTVQNMPNMSRLIFMIDFEKLLLIDKCEKLLTFDENDYFFQPEVQFFNEHLASSLLEWSRNLRPHLGHSIFMYLLMISFW